MSDKFSANDRQLLAETLAKVAVRDLALLTAREKVRAIIEKEAVSAVENFGETEKNVKEVVAASSKSLPSQIVSFETDRMITENISGAIADIRRKIASEISADEVESKEIKRLLEMANRRLNSC